MKRDRGVGLTRGRCLGRRGDDEVVKRGVLRILLSIQLMRCRRSQREEINRTTTRLDLSVRPTPAPRSPLRVIEPCTLRASQHTLEVMVVTMACNVTDSLQTTLFTSNSCLRDLSKEESEGCP